VHQEDDRIQDVGRRRPYLAIGVTVLQRDRSGKLQIVMAKHLNLDRQTEIDIVLEPGEYMILPRTSGCTLKKVPLTPADPVLKLLEGEDLHPILELTIKDIFRRLDKVVVDNILEYPEFLNFYKRIGYQISEEDFKAQIARPYGGESMLINRRGFL